MTNLAARPGFRPPLRSEGSETSAPQASSGSDAGATMASDEVSASLSEDNLTLPLGADKSFKVRRIICIGRNYRAHAREIGDMTVSSEPFYFMKPASAAVPMGIGVNFPPPVLNGSSMKSSWRLPSVRRDETSRPKQR